MKMKAGINLQALAVIGLCATLAIEGNRCFAQGQASPGGGASGGAGPAVGGVGGATGGISGGGISMGGISGGISGGGVTNSMGVNGNMGLNSGSGVTGQTRGMNPGIAPSSPNGLYPSTLYPGGNPPTRTPYALPRARDLRDPLGIGRSPPGSYRRGRAPRPEDLGPVGRANVASTMENHDVWKGVAYISRKGAYEDMVYRTRRGSYRVNSGNTPTQAGGPLRRAGALGDRSIDGGGVPRTLRRTTNRPVRDIGARR
jgi:hypothetical protein